MIESEEKPELLRLSDGYRVVAIASDAWVRAAPRGLRVWHATMESSTCGGRSSTLESTGVRSGRGNPAYLVPNCLEILGNSGANSLHFRTYVRSPKEPGSGSTMGEKGEVVAVQKEPQTNLVHLLRLGKR
jgi:hypothetical protein